ncbi:5-oxoprolinase subunit PxpB [Saccharopolyspora dendranthemae]|uniref:KipI family sensor histidine kinase inhibitor n=1 Tax=Saccharopolyspora dendranthemae TaxID=1181886 RepID=A0A561V8T0_9PSEU|nr:5-oxoprolinase subunit PxpB [Saccharopolyspora dendranthemae]TWG08025.1 KipI family sensor histidine kinase inhibitor [Saccharopolyspora dendranthemae]
MRFLPCADSGLLVELADLQEVHALYAALVDSPPEGVTDLIPAARTLLLQLDPQRADVRAIEEAVRGAEPRAGLRDGGERLEVPVVYDGADLAEVARLTGLTEREVVDKHTGAEWKVAFGGFAPGFGYLAGGPQDLVVPRRTESRTAVPAGAVGLAGAFSGIYPRESPGGWQLIGRTELQIFSIDRDPPALLRPGVRVRFREIG